MINSVSCVSFKAYIPIKFLAKNPETGNYNRIIDKENIRKCQSFVVRNLNGTAKNIKNEKFVEFYKSYDKDYAALPKVHSVYDNKKPVVYMVTGKDTDVIDSLAKPVGTAKGKSMETIGNISSFESRSASRNYFTNVGIFLKNACKRVHSSDGQDLSLVMYFKPVYTKRDKKLTGFEFMNAQFTNQEV